MKWRRLFAYATAVLLGLLLPVMVTRLVHLPARSFGETLSRSAIEL